MIPANPELSQLILSQWTNRPLAIERLRLDALLAHPQAFALFTGQQEKPKPYRMEEGIAVFEIHGPLFGGEMKWRFLEHLFYRNLKKNFALALNDSGVKAILLDLDSPGGNATSDLWDLSDAIYQARKIKPVWAVAEETAFSAAYAIASAASRIYVTQTGGVGSIGVIAVHVEISRENEAMGWTYTLFRGGRYKAEQNYLEPLTAHAKDSIQGEVDRLYGMFVDLVSRNRNLPVEKVRGTEAALYFGENGVQAGLADRVGNFDQAMADLKKLIAPKGMVTMTQTNTQPQTQPHPPEGTRARDETAQPTTTPPVSPPAPSAAASHEPDIPDADTAKIRQQATDQVRAELREITDLCVLAGMREKAAGFIDRKMTPSQVCAELLKLQAEASEMNPVDTRLTPSMTMGKAGATRIDAGEIYNRRHAEMTGKK